MIGARNPAKAKTGLGSKLTWTTKKTTDKFGRGPIEVKNTFSRAGGTHWVHLQRTVSKEPDRNQILELAVDPGHKSYAHINVGADSAGRVSDVYVSGPKKRGKQGLGDLFGVRLFHGPASFDKSVRNARVESEAHLAASKLLTRLVVVGERPAADQFGVFSTHKVGNTETHTFTPVDKKHLPAFREIFATAKQVVKHGGGYDAGRLYDTAIHIRDLIPSALKNNDGWKPA